MRVLHPLLGAVILIQREAQPRSLHTRVTAAASGKVSPYPPPSSSRHPPLPAGRAQCPGCMQNSKPRTLLPLLAPKLAATLLTAPSPHTSAASLHNCAAPAHTRCSSSSPWLMYLLHTTGCSQFTTASYHSLLTIYGSLLATGYSQPAICYPLPATCYPLPATYCLLLATRYLLPTTRFLLPAIQYPLPATRYPPHANHFPLLTIPLLPSTQVLPWADV